MFYFLYFYNLQENFEESVNQIEYIIIMSTF